MRSFVKGSIIIGLAFGAGIGADIANTGKCDRSLVGRITDMTIGLAFAGPSATGMVACEDSDEIYSNRANPNPMSMSVQLTSKCTAGKTWVRVFNEDGTPAMNNWMGQCLAAPCGITVPARGTVRLECGLEPEALAMGGCGWKTW